MDDESRKTNWEAITVGNQVRNDEDLNLGGGGSQFIFYKTHQFHLLENNYICQKMHLLFI